MINSKVLERVVLGVSVIAAANILGCLAYSADRQGTHEVNIAIVQFQPGLDKQINLARLGAFIERAGLAGAELVVLPELCTTGHPALDSDGGPAAYYAENAEPVPGGATTSFMSSLAVRFAMWISWGMVEQDSSTGEMYDSQVLMGPEGWVVGVYRKIHLAPGPEEEIFSPGKVISTYTTQLGEIGMMLSYDVIFPELARTYALLGADLLIVAAASNRMMEECILTVRAHENSTWLVFADQISAQPDELPGILHGNSQVIDAHGNPVAMASADAEEVLSVTVDLTREIEDSLLQRRMAEVYARLPVIYPLNRSEAIGLIVQEILRGHVTGKRVYLSSGPLPAGTRIQSWTEEIRELPNGEWMAFIDDSPDVNWEHPCRYVFIDEVTRDFWVIEATSPPRNPSMMEEILICETAASE